MNDDPKTTLRNYLYQFGWGATAWRAASRIKQKVYSTLLSDEQYAVLAYRRAFGRELDLENPVTFNEKLWWLKLYYRDPLMTTCADKVTVRDYVRSRGLESILVPLYGVYDSPDQIELSSLPPRAFIKTNHGSGYNIRWDSRKPVSDRALRRRLNNALKFNYYLVHREWCYKDIKPKVIVEQMLEQEPFLVDYRFMCFHGRVKLILVDIGTAAGDGSHNPHARRNVYDREFNRIDITIGRESFDDKLIRRPEDLDFMIYCAERLAEPFPHCRVDLYYIGGRVFFGEMTFYHGAGLQRIRPESWDVRMGGWIDLSRSGGLCLA